VKIGPVDPEIICLKLKKEEINASKIYSPSGKFAERAKKSKMVDGRRAAILKTVKCYLCSRVTNFDEIWCDDAY